MDGVLFVHEILHESRYMKQQRLVLKTGSEKPYDNASWEFLFDYLHKCRFNNTWCCWVKSIVVGVTLSVTINNVVGKYFGTHKVLGWVIHYHLLFST
jgi:hypothetical protein